MKNIELTDNMLVSGIRNSDSACFKILYFKYHDSLINFSYLKLNDKEAAKDIVQELFSKIWEKRETLDPEKSIKNYLFTICHNLIINTYKKTNLLKIDGETDSENLEGEEQDLTDQFDGNALKYDIERALILLSEPIRTVFSMSRFDEMKYNEIAEILDISVKTVEARMSKALKFFRVQLRHYL